MSASESLGELSDLLLERSESVLRARIAAGRQLMAVRNSAPASGGLPVLAGSRTTARCAAARDGSPPSQPSRSGLIRDADQDQAAVVVGHRGQGLHQARAVLHLCTPGLVLQPQIVTWSRGMDE
jgi:hypothetical protein